MGSDELLKWLHALPAVGINGGKVKDVKSSEFDGKFEEQDKVILSLQENSEKLQKQLSLDRERNLKMQKQHEKEKAEWERQWKASSDKQSKEMRELLEREQAKA